MRPIQKIILLQEVIIVGMETLGLLLLAAGLGMLAARWIGWAGLAVTGLALVGSAALAARQQRAALRKLTPTPPAAPPVSQPPRESPNGKATGDHGRWSKIFSPRAPVTKP